MRIAASGPRSKIQKAKEASSETSDVDYVRVGYRIHPVDLYILIRGRAFIAGGIAACGAVTATHPFETVKIR